jgi:hypothetical protein
MNASSAESLNDYQNNEMRLQEPQTQQQQQSPNNNTNTTDDDCCSSSWKQWTLQQLDRLNRLVSEIKKKDDDDDDEHSRQQQQRRRLPVAITTGLGVTLLSCLLGYRRHRMRRMTQNSKNNNNYRSAKTAPVSLLFQAAKEGRIQTALLQNSSTNGGGVFYKLVDGIWRQSILPSSSYYTQKELLETLLVHCSDVSVLPEPLLQQLATPLLAALPFVYLAVMYKLMKNIMISNGSGGEDIQKTLHSHSTTSFDDVAGMDDAKQDVAELVQYLKIHKPIWQWVPVHHEGFCCMDRPEQERHCWHEPWQVNPMSTVSWHAVRVSLWKCMWDEGRRE